MGVGLGVPQLSGERAEEALVVGRRFQVVDPTTNTGGCYNLSL
jgi:hypothetical protein